MSRRRATELIALLLAALMPAGAALRAQLRIDSAAVERLVAPAAALERMRADDDFDYGRAYREPESFFDAIMRWISDWFREMLGADGIVTFWDVVGYVILGAAIVFVAIKLSDADTRALFFRKKSETDAEMTLLEEDVHGIDYATQIERAVAAGDLRLAVRLHYLRLLRDLSERGAIAWRADKTDHDYVRELRDAPLRSAFERAALMFEYVWYGDFPIDHPSYERVAAVIDRAGRTH